ncbi:MAG: Nif3-like dinuclear metal center hexameric protein [Bacteroidales bacterium]|nr:Nif3-like dinuclear metal center hexameric protein [Bacteroidales bacterium]
MKVRDIAAALEAFAPLESQEAWDNAGLCIGSPEAEVHAVLAGFDCTPALVREAVDRGADMIVTHHPLIFGGLKRIDPDDPVGAAVYLAVRHGIAVYAAHTNADKAAGGVNALMAGRLGLVEPEPLDESGLAQIGLLPEPMEGRAFCRYVKERFGLKTLRCSAPVAEVFRVATSCGSGASFADQAFRAGADAFVTGDVSYHRFFVPEGRMIVDIGHYESEAEIVSKFVSVLQEKLPNFAVYTATTANNNPIYYY